MAFTTKNWFLSLLLGTAIVVFQLLPLPASAESVLNAASKPSLQILDSYHQALEKTLNQWPERNGQTPLKLTSTSRDLMNRLDQLIELLKEETANPSETEPIRIHRHLLALYEAHHEVTREALDAQIVAYEQREEERARVESQRDQSSRDQEEKEDIEKVFDAIFGSRSEESQSTSEKTEPAPSEPITNFKRPLFIERRILDGVTTETQFLLDLNESDTTSKRTKLWLNHLESLLGKYLNSLYGNSSTAPLFANQYRQHLEGLREAWNDKAMKVEGELRIQFMRSLERQEQILGGVPYSVSSEANDLERTVGKFLREL